MNKSLVTIVASANGSISMIDSGSLVDFEFAEEKFECVSVDVSWFGFYDWLRTLDGKVIQGSRSWFALTFNRPTQRQ